MDYKLKRLYKKLAKIFEIISSTILIILALGFIGFFVYLALVLKNTGNTPIDTIINGNGIIIYLASLTIIFIVGLCFSILAANFRRRLIDYKKYIYTYRQYRVFLIIIDLANQHLFAEVVDLYNSYLKINLYKDFLHGYILGCESHSNDFLTLEHCKEDTQTFINSVKPQSKYNK